MPNTNKPKDSNNDAKGSAEKIEPKKRGWSEIESLFDTKKAKTKQDRLDEDSAAKQKKKMKQAYKATAAKQSADTSRGTKEDWVDDGLGGRFNGEGYTGRVEDGVKVFKAHVLSKPNAGNTPQCPFDCDCCFI